MNFGKTACEDDAIVDACAAEDGIAAVGKNDVAEIGADDVGADGIVDGVEEPIGAEGGVGSVDGAGAVVDVEPEVESVIGAVDDEVDVVVVVRGLAERVGDLSFEIRPSGLSDVENGVIGDDALEYAVEHKDFGEGLIIEDDVGNVLGGILRAELIDDGADDIGVEPCAHCVAEDGVKNGVNGVGLIGDIGVDACLEIVDGVLAEDVLDGDADAIEEDIVDNADDVVDVGVLDVGEQLFDLGVEEIGDVIANGGAVDGDVIAVDGDELFDGLEKGIDFILKEIGGVNIGDVDGGDIIALPNESGIGAGDAADGFTVVGDGVVVIGDAEILCDAEGEGIARLEVIDDGDGFISAVERSIRCERCRRC